MGEGVPKPVPSSEVPDEATSVESIASDEVLTDLPQEGELVTLTKQSVAADEESSIAKGRRFDGVVLGEISIGKSVSIGTANTTPVRAISRSQDGSFLITTNTSVYKLERRTKDSGPVQNEAVAVPVEEVPEPLKEGEKVAIQKVSILDFNKAEGERMDMTLQADLREGVEIAAASADNLFNSSVIKKITSAGGKFYVTTDSGSVYALERRVG